MESVGYPETLVNTYFTLCNIHEERSQYVNYSAY